MGFLAADGYNTNDGISIAVHTQDRDILNFIRKEISPDSPIREYKSNLSRLDIYSCQMSRDLNALGIVKNKSKTLIFPEIEPKYFSHFLRGCFDGDGNVGFRKYSDGRTKQGIYLRYVSASLPFIEKFKQILKTSCHLEDRVTYLHGKGAWYISYCGSKQVKKIYEYLYKDADFSLTRKFDKFKMYYS